MGRIFRIGIATLFGTMLVAGAILFGRQTTPAPVSNAEVVVGTFTREYQETRDTDGDGMRDWEEELRGRDPLTADAPGTTSIAIAVEPEEPYVPPATITGKFGQEFFRGYVERGTSMSEEEEAEFLSASVSSLVDAANTRPYTRTDILIGTSDDLDAVRTYGNDAGVALAVAFQPKEGDPLSTLHRALKESDAALLASLGADRDQYRALTDELRNISVPPSLIDEHLILVNVTGALAEDVAGMMMAFEDPLRALVDAKEYQSDFENLFTAFDGIRRTLEERGVVYTNDEWGMFFFSLRP